MYKIKDKIKKHEYIKDFVSCLGNGKNKLTKEQIDKRKEKVLGKDSECFIGLGTNKEIGVPRIKKKARDKKTAGNSHIDCFDEDFYNNIDKYPTDVRLKEGVGKIINVSIKDSGELYIDGLVIDGKENVVKDRIMYSFTSLSDEDLAMLEKKQFEKGTLKKVSDRTMNIHEAEGILDAMLDAEDIDTEDDLECEY